MKDVSEMLGLPKAAATGFDLHDSVLRACCPYKLFLSARGGAAGKQDNPCRAT